MTRTLISAMAVGLLFSAAVAEAREYRPAPHDVQLADNDADKRVVIKRKPHQTVRRTVTERPNGTDVRRTVTERANGSMTSRVVRDRPNGNVRVTRKVVRAPRRFHVARPWVAPRGFVFRHFRLGERVPSLLLAATYFLADYSLYGLEPPPPGYVWIREGADAVLVDRYTGEVIQVQEDVFY
jgi:Ni/Co efflux regulator RcnB